MSEYIDERTFVELFSPGKRVYVGAYTNEPNGLIEIIAAHGKCAAGVTFIQQPLVINIRDLSELGPDAQMLTFFMTPVLKQGFSSGRVHYLPMQMRAVHDYIEQSVPDIALLQVAKDSNGELRFGPAVDFVQAALVGAKQVVLQVNPQITAPLGCPLVDMQAPYLMLEASSDPLLFPIAKVDETSQEIGSLVASIVADGDCLQTGVGAVPAAILSGLGDRNDLGFHGGLIDDGVMQLAIDGNLTGKRKAIDIGKHVTGIALGSQDLLDWLAQESTVVFKSANYTHEIGVIRQLDNFVSINSALEIDLFGQVNAEVTGGRQISGTGGSVDFMRASKSSKGGRSIVAMSATARRGEISRIVPRVEMVTALRTDVDIVVTEFGVARLKDASLEDRARKLIDIAHPTFRDQLKDELKSVLKS